MTTLALRSFFQQLVLKDSSSPPNTNEGAPLNTAQVVEKLAHKEPALLYFYHKNFPDADHVNQKLVSDMVAKVIRDAKESAKSPRMKPRSYVPPKIGRSRTSDHCDKTSTTIQREGEEEEAKKLILLSNLQGIFREAIMLNELQEESHKRSESVQKVGIGRRVDVPYTPDLTSKGKTTRRVNEQKSQAAPSSNVTVKVEEGNFLPPPLPVIDRKSEEGHQKDSTSTQPEASTSKRKGSETKNEQKNQAISTSSSSNSLAVNVEKTNFALSETAIDFMVKGNDHANFEITQPSTSKGECAEKVTEQKDRAAPTPTSNLSNVRLEKENPRRLPPVVVDLKVNESEKNKDSTSTKGSTSMEKVAEPTLNEQSNRPSPTRRSNVNVEKDKAAFSEFVIDFIPKEEAQKYFRYNPASTSKWTTTEKLNEQKDGAASTSSESINIKADTKEKVVPVSGVANLKSKETDRGYYSTFAQTSTSKGKSAEKVDVQGAAADLKFKESDQKHTSSTQASTSNGKINSDHVNVKVEKGAAPSPPPPVTADQKSKGDDRKQSGSTQASTSDGKSSSDHFNIKVEKERAAPPPPPVSSSDAKSKGNDQKAAPPSPPPVRRQTKVEDISQQEEIYVSSAHARERADKSRLRQAQDSHLRSGGRVVPKPEPVNSNPTQESVKPKPTEKGKESEERKSEPSGRAQAGSSKAEATAKPESKSTESNSSNHNTSSSSSKVSSGIQTEPVKEFRSTGTSSSSSQVPRGQTRSEYPAAGSPPPKARYEGNYGESNPTNGYRYDRPLPAKGAPFSARCSGITNEGRQCLLVVRTIFDGENLKPFCQWHGAYYGSGKPKSLDPNKKERGRCSATTRMGTLCKRDASYYGSTKSEYGYCWQHERMYGFGY